MYLHSISIENFRKFKLLKLEFNKGLNLLVGENDSGKTAIIDAVKLLLGTHSNDWQKLHEDDFFIKEGNREKQIKIVCKFCDLSEHEAALFLEWLSINSEDNSYYLKLTLTAKRKEKSSGITEIFYDIKAGEDEESGTLSGEAKNKLRVTYLKPLRDAQSELKPRRRSRLSQILANYDIFETEDGEEHTLLGIMNTANTDIESYFESGEGKQVYEVINNNYLKAFSLEHNKLTSNFQITANNLSKILEKLELKVSNEGQGNLGLGSHNLLFIATEMLLLKVEKYVGLKLSLIEEIEAHLHPQSQLNLIGFLNQKSEGLDFQSIITTHSNSLASKVNLDNIILCRNGNAFSLRKGLTKLSNGDYGFLNRFLDDTKANLFFANGVIIVEGAAENLLIPALAEVIGFPLHKHGISIVNVGSTALLRYARIFLRIDENDSLNINVSVITDLDIKPKKFFEENGHEIPVEYQLTEENMISLKEEFGSIEGIDFTNDRRYSRKSDLIKDVKKKIPNALRVKTKAGEFLSKILTPNPISLENLDDLKRNAHEKRNHTEQNVKYFISPNWTLEYELGLSCLRKLFYISILLAESFQHTDSLEFDEDFDWLFENKKSKAEKDFASWDGLTNEEIAYKLYWEIMQKKDKGQKVSKAIVAQMLSKVIHRELTNGNTTLKQTILDDENLKYLVEAIKYAANVSN